MLVMHFDFVCEKQDHGEVLQRLVGDVADLVVDQVACEQNRERKYFDINIVASLWRVQAFDVKKKDVCACISSIRPSHGYELAPHPDTTSSGFCCAPNAKALHPAQHLIAEERLARLVWSSHRHDSQLPRLVLLKRTHSLSRHRELAIRGDVYEFDWFSTYGLVDNSRLDKFH